MRRLVELYGWYGAGAIVLGYALVSFSVIEATGLVYQVLNATGAFGVVLVSFYKRAYQPGVLNVIWTLIALFAIVRIVR